MVQKRAMLVGSATNQTISQNKIEVVLTREGDGASTDEPLKFSPGDKATGEGDRANQHTEAGGGDILTGKNESCTCQLTPGEDR